MNTKFKTISAALLAAAMCASLAGCANNEKPNNKDTELNESNIESHIESLFGGGESSSAPETSEPEEVKIEMTDEIKNAALNSGLVQLNNDIFQRGGYITVADFVEKYKDRFDITYFCPDGAAIKEAGTYDECKDYLVEYRGEIFDSQKSLGPRWKDWRYSLKLTPKNQGTIQPVVAYVINATSPDEKITLDKAIIGNVNPFLDSHYKFVTPEWIPMGFNDSDFKEYESENKSYSAKDLFDAIETNGLTKNATFENSGFIPGPSIAENWGTYWKSGWGTNFPSIGCYILGEENLFGAKPLYYYNFYIDPNTNKVKYVNCELKFFVKE